MYRCLELNKYLVFFDKTLPVPHSKRFHLPSSPSPGCIRFRVNGTDGSLLVSDMNTKRVTIMPQCQL